jgi:Protein of unknown function DUF262.
MQVAATQFTVGEYCEQLRGGQVLVNRDYQRSAKVWPTAAKSYLIDTLLLGFPIPKLTLYQRTDPASRRVIKEIVDGQQRSEAICQYVSGRFRLSTKSPNAGKRFSQLDEADQVRLLEYAINFDVLVGATREEIRELFRRINSYTVPLNRQETRHAIFQGEFKWFIVELSERYASTTKEIGLFSESQLTRMADGEMVSELVMAIESGIRTASPAAITDFYERNEKTFARAEEMRRRFSTVFDRLLRWDSIHDGPLMKAYQFYSLFLAITHVDGPVDSLQAIVPLDRGRPIDDETALVNLGTLSDVASSSAEVDDDAKRTESQEVEESLEIEAQYDEFRKAAAEGTNIQTQRETRFKWFVRALGPDRI